MYAYSELDATAVTLNLYCLPFILRNISSPTFMFLAAANCSITMTSLSDRVLLPDFINSLLILLSYLSTEMTLTSTSSSLSSVTNGVSNTSLASASFISASPTKLLSSFSGNPDAVTNMSAKLVSM
ncbi:hypothetical protein DSECCO2_586660 [anaerobic digester metagenome]